MLTGPERRRRWSSKDRALDARKISLLAAIEDIGAKSFKYFYDFGDGWAHSIKIERTFPSLAVLSQCSSRPPDAALPRTSAGHGLSGVPRDERHAELDEWWGSEDYDADKANFAELVKASTTWRQWGPKPRRKI